MLRFSLVAAAVERLLADHGVAHTTLAVACRPCEDDRPEGGWGISDTPPGAGSGDGSGKGAEKPDGSEPVGPKRI